MNKYIFLSMIGLGLIACQKSDSPKGANPAPETIKNETFQNDIASCRSFKGKLVPIKGILQINWSAYRNLTA